MPDEELTVFYAWQSDSLSRDNRNFIESALEQSFKNLHKAGKVEASPRLDKDTKGVSGIPDIANTIFDKIRFADIFVADLSFVGKSPPKDEKTKLLPNPNVMLELGYALSELGWERIALIINTTTGSKEELPFDLRNRRWPIEYQLPPDAVEAVRTEEKRKLTKQLEDAIGAIAKLPPRQKKGTADQRLEALETMVSSLSGSIAQYTTLANLVSGLQKVTTTSRDESNDPKSRCQRQFEDLVKRLAAGKFEKVAFQEGMLAMAIYPTSSPTPLLIFDSKLNLELRPFDANGWSPLTYGERLVNISKIGDAVDAATEITLDGRINAAGHHVVAIDSEFFSYSGRKPPAHLAIPSVAYEKRIIEAVFDYIKALKSVGTKGPWYVCLGIINLQKSVLYVDVQFSFGGRAYEGNEILPPVIEIVENIGLANPQEIAKTLRPVFDYIWREHGYPKSLNYADTGDWVGR